MKSVDLNLATRPFRNDTPMLVLLGVLAVVAVSFTGYNTYSYMTADSRAASLRDELTDHRALMANIERETTQLRARLGDVPVAQMETQASFVAAVLQERNFSWTGLFNELERRVPWNTRLTSVRPTFESDAVLVGLIGVSQDFDAFLQLQTKLAESPRISAVLPSEYQTDKETNRVNFALRFSYDPSVSLDGAMLASSSDDPGTAEGSGVDEGADLAAIEEEPTGRRKRRGRAAAGDRPGFPQIDEGEGETTQAPVAGSPAERDARAAADTDPSAPGSEPGDGGGEETAEGGRAPFGVPDLQGQRNRVAGDAQQREVTPQTERRVTEDGKDYDRSRWPIDPFDPRRIGRPRVLPDMEEMKAAQPGAQQSTAPADPEGER